MRLETVVKAGDAEPPELQLASPVPLREIVKDVLGAGPLGRPPLDPGDGGWDEEPDPTRSALALVARPFDATPRGPDTPEEERVGRTGDTDDGRQNGPCLLERLGPRPLPVDAPPPPAVRVHERDAPGPGPAHGLVREEIRLPGEGGAVQVRRLPGDTLEPPEPEDVALPEKPVERVEVAIPPAARRRPAARGDVDDRRLGLGRPRRQSRPVSATSFRSLPRGTGRTETVLQVPAPTPPPAASPGQILVVPVLVVVDVPGPVLDDGALRHEHVGETRRADGVEVGRQNGE